MQEIVKIWFDSNVFQDIKSMNELCKYISKSVYFKMVKQNFICSDFFPFRGEDYYIIKPVATTKGLLNLSIANHKYHRTLQYVCISELKAYFWGGYDFENNANISFGKIVYDKTTGIQFELKDDVGVYFFVDLDSKEDYEKFDSYIMNIGVSDLQNIKCIQRIHYPISQDAYTAEKTIYIGLNDINTWEISAAQLEYLINNSCCQVVYSDKKNCVKIKSGMCIEGDVVPWLNKMVYMLKS